MSEEVTNEEIVSRIKNGEKELIGELWNRVKQFARVKAKDMHAGDMTEDLEQEGFLAMLDAVKNYEEDKGAQFLTYAAFHFRSRMWRYMHHEAGGREIPFHMIEKTRKYRRTVADFRRDFGRDPFGVEIMDRCGWTMRELTTVIKGLNADRTASLDAPLTEDESLTLADTVQDDADPAEMVEDRAFHEQLKRDLWETVDQLPEIQADVIRGRYKEGLTLEKVGERKGFNREKARQTEAKALRNLRTGKSLERLRPFYQELYGSAVQCGGPTMFSRTWTSSTEREAIRLLETEEKRLRAARNWN